MRDRYYKILELNMSVDELSGSARRSRIKDWFILGGTVIATVVVAFLLQ